MKGNHKIGLSSLKFATRRSLGLCTIAPFVLSVIFLQSIGPTQIKEIRRVLVLYEVGPYYPAIALVDQGIHDAVEKSSSQIELYREYLDTGLFTKPASQQEFIEWYVHKYRDRKPNVIITVGPTPVELMLNSRESFFHDVPVVFCASTEEAAGSPKLPSNFTGIWEETEPSKTLDAALRLQPGTKHVFVVGGTSPYDRSMQALLRTHLRSYETKLDFEYLTELAMPQLLDHLRQLPNHSVVLHAGILRDAAGTQFIDATEAGPMVARAANAPVFTFSDVNLGHGEEGGDVSSFAEDGRVAGALALRILGGEKPQDIPVAKGNDVYMFDWRALERWGLKESNLPPGSIVVNRPQSFWQLYKRYVLTGILVFLVQAAAIIGLLWQRSRRRRTEAELRKSEEKFSRSFRQSPLVVAISRTSDSRFIDVNESFEEQFGWTRDEVIGRTPVDFGLWVDADQRATFLKQLRTNRSVRNLEACLRKKDGETRTALVSAELIEVGGEPCTVSVAADITERKRAEEVLSTVSRKLIEAHEDERTRIARELHDDINQRLAFLAVTLSNLKNDVPASEAPMREHVEQVRQEVSDLGKDVQALSHRLHSSKLEYLGLAVAARSFCKEFSERHNVEIEFHSGDVPRNLPSEISLSLFRVLQEALQNAAKYSGTRRFEVTLERTSDEIQLSVHDSGVGFDPESTTNGHGLGLVSMTERLKLVDGQLLIDSKPQCGTTIRARVSLNGSIKTAAAHA